MLFGKNRLSSPPISNEVFFCHSFDTINSSVTHIIRGSEPTSNYSQISSTAPQYVNESMFSQTDPYFFMFSAHVVNPQWLLDCCEKGELMPEADYQASTDRDEK